MERTHTDEASAEVVTPDFRHAPAAVEALTAALWHERDVLDSLLFTLSAQQQLLVSGGTRWLARSSVQVRELVEQLREVEVVRSMIVVELVAELGLASEPSLLHLGDAVGEPTASIFRDLHGVAGALVEEIDRAVQVNDELLLSLVTPGPAHPRRAHSRRAQ